MPKTKNKSAFSLRELRLVATDNCPYSCRYCNLYFKKLLAQKKISLQKLKSQYLIGNESACLLAPNTKEAFSLADYQFLFTVLRDQFKLADVTFSGGDAFLAKDFPKLVNLAVKLGLRTTAITKGAPLFSLKSSRDCRRRFGSLKRIIFSLDTLDAKEHALTNLPLVPFSRAIKYLPQTLAAIRFLVKAGYEVEVNSVLVKPGSSSWEKVASFKRTKALIDFCFESGLRRLKFIELDSSKTIGHPYLETYFKEMVAGGYLEDYGRTKISAAKINDRDFSRKLIEVATKKDKTKKGPGFKVIAYRTHCPSSALSGQKRCRFSLGGELNLDFHGRSFYCQKDKDFKYHSLFSAVRSRDHEALARELKAIRYKVLTTKCPVIK